MSSQSHETLITVEGNGRPRVLVVGDEELVEHVSRGAGEARVDRAPTYLDAMGEVTLHPADVIIGPVAAMAGLIESTAGGLRRLAPHCRLVVIAEPGQEIEAAKALDAGFDQYLLSPLDPEQVSRALRRREPDGSHEPPKGPLPALRPETPPVEDAELGDVDMVDALLDGGGVLSALAMRIVAARSDIKAVALTPMDETVPKEHARIVVTYHENDYGVLHAPPPADAEQLTPWADWLGRWLALDDQVNQLKRLAMRDELTGTWNRRYFNRFLSRILDRAAEDRSQVTLLVFDIDDFKLYNDRYGHGAGDEILRETARLMQAVVREHDVVARIGGDEFAVIFWDAEGPRKPNSTHPHDAAKAARRFQHAICEHKFPKLLNDAPGTLTISGGLASFPWDGRTPDELLAQADAMALRSKQQGKNAITFGPGAMRVCEIEP